MWRDFEGGIYWDELAEACGNISRAVGLMCSKSQTKVRPRWLYQTQIFCGYASPFSLSIISDASEVNMNSRNANTKHVTL